MKRIVLIFLLLPTAVLLMAQQFMPIMPTLEVENIALSKTNTEVTITFQFRTDYNAVRADNFLVIEPLIMSNTSVSRLPAILVEGKRGDLIRKRHMLAAGLREDGFKYRIKPGLAINYKATIPYADWMKGGTLSLHGVRIKNCAATKVVLGDLVTHLFLDSEGTNGTGGSQSGNTTAWQLAAKHNFLVPVSRFNPQMFDVGQSALTIYFSQGSSHIEWELKNNRWSLIELLSVIRMINASKDSRVALVAIAPFVSPGETSAVNDGIVRDRVSALKQYIIQNGMLFDRDIHIYQNTPDGTGLRNNAICINVYYQNL